MPRPSPPTARWDKIGAICGRIVRTCVETAEICGKIVAISDKTTETFGLTDRIFGKTKGPCGKDGNSCSRMNVQEPLLGNSNRIGKT